MLPRTVRNFVQTRVLTPVLNLLRIGATPERLAWSLAVGAVIGINPIVGTTTVLCLAVAAIFRLNLVASQITNHLMFPVQLALVVVWLSLGEMLFRTGPLPLDSSAFIRALHERQWQTVHLLWTWQWHALIVWLLAAVVFTPLLAFALRPILQRLLFRLQHQAIVEK